MGKTSQYVAMHPELALQLIRVKNAELDRVARRAVVAHADAVSGRSRRPGPRRAIFARLTLRGRTLRDLYSAPAAAQPPCAYC
jgi:hypothetical protein